MKEKINIIENLLKKLEKGEILSSLDRKFLCETITSSFLLLHLCMMIQNQNEKNLTQFSITTTN